MFDFVARHWRDVPLAVLACAGAVLIAKAVTNQKTPEEQVTQEEAETYRNIIRQMRAEAPGSRGAEAKGSRGAEESDCSGKRSCEKCCSPAFKRQNPVS
jgi:hypothetical protein